MCESEDRHAYGQLVHRRRFILGLPAKKGSDTKSRNGRRKGVRHQKPERPFGCFALLVSDPFFAAFRRVDVSPIFRVDDALAHVFLFVVAGGPRDFAGVFEMANDVDDSLLN